MFGFEISEGLKQKLDSFCKEQKPFPVFLATLQPLLFRYTSQKEIAIFTRTASGSSSPKLVQYLSHLDDSLTFKQLLDAAKESEMNSTDREKFLLEALETKDPGRPPPSIRLFRMSNRFYQKIMYCLIIWNHQSPYCLLI